MARQRVVVTDLGRIHYQEAWSLQQRLLDDLVAKKRGRREGTQPNIDMHHHILLCEHYPVYTLGRTGKEAHLLMSQKELAEEDIAYHRINRGGDITFHGLGQVVAYPIFDLDFFFTDVHKYVRFLEEAVIRTLASYQIAGTRIKDYTGVWISDDEQGVSRKICAIGVHLSRWVTMHGLAFNVNTDLAFFQRILPCGISDSDKEVTSLAKEVGHKVSADLVKHELVKHFSDLFGFDYQWGTSRSLSPEM